MREREREGERGREREIGTWSVVCTYPGLGKSFSLKYINLNLINLDKTDTNLTK